MQRSVFFFIIQSAKLEVASFVNEVVFLTRWFDSRVFCYCYGKYKSFSLSHFMICQLYLLFLSCNTLRFCLRKKLQITSCCQDFCNKFEYVSICYLLHCSEKKKPPGAVSMFPGGGDPFSKKKAETKVNLCLTYHLVKLFFL